VSKCIASRDPSTRPSYGSGAGLGCRRGRGSAQQQLCCSWLLFWCLLLPRLREVPFSETDALIKTQKRAV